MFAYTGVVKSITEIKAKTGAFKAALFIDFMKDLIDWLSKNDPEAVAVIEGVFDDFVQYAREKYAA
jgi:inhibitor of KinA sporulation pathway (predicted exonuclease)